MELVFVIVLAIIPLLLAISLHEAAHGWAADKLGDATARMLGRLTANPIKHIDPVGTLLIPVTLLIISQGSFAFGWAKPVPVDVRNFKNPQKDMALVALAGPMANLAMAVLWILLLLFSIKILPQGYLASLLGGMAEIGVMFNLIFMTLNLLPIPPLDGGRVLSGVLPQNQAIVFNKIEPYGMWIIIFLLISGILGKILWPTVQAIQLTLYSLMGLG